MLFILLLLFVLWVICLVLGYVVFAGCLLIAGTSLWGMGQVVRGWFAKEANVRGRDVVWLVLGLVLLLVLSPWLYWQLVVWAF